MIQIKMKKITIINDSIINYDSIIKHDSNINDE